jgi:hypothetical protein
MFVGHIAVAMIAKRARPAPSLGWYVAAASTLDLLWPIFLLIGIERRSVAGVVRDDRMGGVSVGGVGRSALRA